jgi:hypothetical protein
VLKRIAPFAGEAGRCAVLPEGIAKKLFDVVFALYTLLAFINAALAVSNAGCTWGATLFAELNAALACENAPLAYTPAVTSAIGAPLPMTVAVKFILLFPSMY